MQVLSDSSYGFNNPIGIASDGVNIWITNYDNSPSISKLNKNPPYLKKN